MQNLPEAAAVLGALQGPGVWLRGPGSTWPPLRAEREASLWVPPSWQCGALTWAAHGWTRDRPQPLGSFPKAELSG